MKTSVAILALAAMVSACQHSPHPPVTQVPFNEEEVAAYRGEGSGTIQGQAFLKTMGGDVKYAAGNKVILSPWTPYFQARTEALVRGQELLPRDPKANAVMRETIADGQGGFVFEKVPPGQYFILSDVVWMAPSSFGGLVKTGGIVGQLVDVKPGETIRVMVTRG